MGGRDAVAPPRGAAWGPFHTPRAWCWGLLRPLHSFKSRATLWWLQSEPAYPSLSASLLWKSRRWRKGGCSGFALLCCWTNCGVAIVSPIHPGAAVQALLRWGGRVETRFTVGGKHNTQLGPAET